MAAARGIGVAPFYQLTAERHDMHRRHFCSYSNQKKVGRCCDCTHFCYTPLFWDHFFKGLGEAITSHPNFDGAAPLASAGVWGRGGRRRRRRGGRAARSKPKKLKA